MGEHFYEALYRHDQETLRRYREEICPSLEREIEVLTAERDNALLRIEELERACLELEDRLGVLDG